MGRSKDSLSAQSARPERRSRAHREAVLVGLSALSLAGLGRALRARSSAAEVEAQRAADGWLDLVDQGKFVESWDAAAPLFKTALTQKQWRAALNAARSPLARPLSRTVRAKRVVTPLAGELRGQYVVIDYASIYEGGRQATETVTPMLDADGQWRIASYFIR